MYGYLAYHHIQFLAAAAPVRLPKRPPFSLIALQHFIAAIRTRPRLRGLYLGVEPTVTAVSLTVKSVQQKYYGWIRMFSTFPFCSYYTSVRVIGTQYTVVRKAQRSMCITTLFRTQYDIEYIVQLHFCLSYFLLVGFLHCGNLFNDEDWRRVANFYIKMLQRFRQHGGVLSRARDRRKKFNSWECVGSRSIWCTLCAGWKHLKTPSEGKKQLVIIKVNR